MFVDEFTGKSILKAKNRQLIVILSIVPEQASSQNIMQALSHPVVEDKASDLLFSFSLHLPLFCIAHHSPIISASCLRRQGLRKCRLVT